MRSDCSRIEAGLWTFGDGCHFRRCVVASMRPRARPRHQCARHDRLCFSHRFPGPPTMAGVPAETQGSTALKALATDKISSGILQSANLLHLLRSSSHPEVVAKLPKDLSLKVPIIKTTGELLEQMPSVIVALDLHLDSAIRSLSMLKEVRSILVDSPHNLPTPLPTTHAHDSGTER